MYTSLIRTCHQYFMFSVTASRSFNDCAAFMTLLSIKQILGWILNTSKTTFLLEKLHTKQM